MEPISRLLLTYVTNALWIVCAAAVMAKALEKFLNRGPGVYRHVLWVAALVIAALLPLSSLRGFTNTSQGALSVLQSTNPLPSPTHEPSEGQGRGTQQRGKPISVPPLATEILAACYIGFLAFRGAQLLVGWRRATSLLQRPSERSVPSPITVVVDRCCAEMGISKPLTVCWLDSAGPLTLGIRHSVLVLPSWFLDVSDEDITAAVCHELAHVRRHDFLMNIVYDLLFLPVAFHPIATWIKRRIDQTRELSCDEAAAGKLSRVSYARSLLSIAKIMSRMPPSIASANTLGLFDSDELEERIMNLVEKANPIGKRSAKIAASVALALLAICCLVISIVSIQIVRPAVAADGAQRSPYSSAQYIAYLAEHGEKGRAQLKLLDDFVTQYPESALLPYVYHDYYLSYYGQRNYAQTIAYADKLLAFGNKLDVGMRLETLVARAQSYLDGASDPAFQTSEAKKRARSAAAEGLKALNQWQRPQGLTNEKFVAQKNKMNQLFESVRRLATN